MNKNDGFVHFVAVVRHSLILAAYDLCGDWHEAEDLTQITLAKMYARWGHLNDHQHLAKYARKVLVRCYLQERRHIHWRTEVAMADIPENGATVIAVDDRIVLLSAIAQLEIDQRAVVVLRFWEDLSVEQTAVILGFPGRTVVSLTRKALRILRSTLGNRRPTP